MVKFFEVLTATVIALACIAAAAFFVWETYTMFTVEPVTYPDLPTVTRVDPLVDCYAYPELCIDEQIGIDQWHLDHPEQPGW